MTELLQGLIRDRHDEPAGQRDRCRGAPARVPRGRAASSASSTRGCPERANLVARIPGRGDGPAARSSSRTRTSCSPTRRSGAPTRSAASCATGEVWGRGALDMKGQVAASAVAIASLAREGLRAARRPDLRRDRRRGGGRRLRRAVALRGASRRGSLRLPASTRAPATGRARRQAVLHLLDAEKMSAPFRPARARTQRPRVDAGDRGQRARQGGAADRRRSARTSRSRQLDARGRGDASKRSPVAAPTSPEEALERARAASPLLAEMVEPLLSMTLSPTMARRRRSGTSSRPSATSRSTAGSCRGMTTDDAERDRPRGARRRRLRARVARGARRHALADRDAAVGRGRVAGSRRSTRGEAGADLRRRLHGQPLDPRGVRHGRVRVLPVARDGPRDGRAPDPLRRRARARSRTSSSASSFLRHAAERCWRAGCGIRL